MACTAVWVTRLEGARGEGLTPQCSKREGDCHDARDGWMEVNAVFGYGMGEADEERDA